LIDDEDIRALREEIDSIDVELIRLYAKRMEFIIEVGKIKKRKNIPIEDKERSAEVLKHVAEEAKKHGLDEKKVVEFWKNFIECAIKEQEGITTED